MPTGQYPFIDIAVHDQIRDRFAAGDAVIVLSLSLSDIVWVNTAGAHLFGHRGIYDFMDVGFDRDTASFRQIQTAAQALVDHADSPAKSFVMRAGSAFRRPILPATLERLALPDGNRALLLTAALAEPAKSPDARAAHIIDGFSDLDTHAAVLDAGGKIWRATPSFARLAIEPAVCARIVEDVAAVPDRLVKHPIRTALGLLPAAIARIADDLNLLIAVEMSIGNLDPAPEQSAEPTPRLTPKPAPEPTPSVLNLAAKPTAKVATQALKGSKLPEPIDPKDFVFNPRKRPVRFVWKIDDQGIFSEISAEFAATVGPNAADIQGRKFVDVAQVFNIDPDNSIADLLQKRDTWSGKTVHWPVQGTDLRVPVDLAALPTYSRDRAFDGFRGFGIVRSSDAESDPERIGLALAANADRSALFAEPTEEAAEPAVPESLETTEPLQDQDLHSTGMTDAEPFPDDVAPADTPPSAADEPTADDFGGQNAADTAPDTAPDKDDEPPEESKPAIEITPSPGRRLSDKIIRLEERRGRPREGLTTSERQAFQEIARRLGGNGEESGDAEPVSFGKRQAPPSDETAAPDRDSAAAPEFGTEESPTPTPSQHGAPTTETHDTPDQPGTAAPPARGGARLTPDILDMLPTPIVIHDGSVIFYLNEEFRRFTGYPSTGHLNNAGGLNALFSGREAADNARSSDNRDGRLILHLADGATASVQARLRSIDWIDGRALMLAFAEMPASKAMTTDGERAASLQVEVDELRSILETATDGVVLLDEGGVIRSMNRSAAALFDYDDGETLGRPFAMLFAHESQRAVQDYLTGLTGKGVASVLNDGREVIGREASGGFLPLFMTIGHLSGSNGYCAVMRDITHWKRAEEDLRSAKREAETANALKSEFLARVSHEIRTPLNAIIGFSELMAEERFGPIGSPRYVEYAHDIGRSGKHVLDIVNDLLDISKIEAGEQELDFQAVSLNQALLDAMSILQPQANRQRVIVRTSLSSSVPDVVADLRSIKQIAINILSNAVRFTPAGGQVVVSTSYEQNGNVSLRIRDTGVGMSRDQLEEAMRPFRQVTGFLRERGDGTGLGLPLAKAMAEANRAQFAMNSQPGRGTLVEITFPSQRVLAE